MPQSAARPVTLRGRAGFLAARLHLPAGHPAGGHPCVIASHGLYSDKSSEKLVALGRALPRRGIALLRYDCRGCGESQGLFAGTTAGTRVEDLLDVLRWARRQPEIDGRRLGLMGSSMGGFASLYVAATDQRLRAVVAWAAPAHFGEAGARPGEAEQQETQTRVRREAGLPEPDAAGRRRRAPAGSRRPLPDYPPLLDVAPALRRVLLLHGEEDEVVPVEHARLLRRLAGTPAELAIFPRGDHRFSVAAARHRAIGLTCRWFVIHLGC